MPNLIYTATGIVTVLARHGLTDQDLLTKSVSPTIGGRNTIFTYTVTFTPANPISGTFTVNEILPPGLTFYSDAPGTLSLNLVAGEPYTFTFQVKPTSDVSLNTLLQNEVRMNDGLKQLTARDEGVTIIAPAFTATKTNSVQGSPALVQPGEIYTYSVTVESQGYTNWFTVTDYLPAGLSLLRDTVEVFIDGAPTDNWHSSIIPNPQNVDAFGVSVIDTLLPGQTAVVTYQVQVSPDAQPNTVFRNTAHVEYHEDLDNIMVDATDPNPPIVAAPSINSATKTGILSMPEDGNGGIITWTVTATNGGPGTEYPINISDVLQQGQQFNGQVSATIGGASVPVTLTNADPSNPAFQIDAPLQVGQTVSLTFQATLPNIPNPLLNIDPGSLITDTALVEDTPAGPATVTLPSPSFTAMKSPSTFNPEPGSSFSYTITATNTGNLAALPFTITDPLPTTTNEFGNPIPLVTYDGGPVTATLSNYTEPVSVTVSGTASTPIFTLNQIVRPGQTVALTFPVTLSTNAPIDTPIRNDQAYVQGYPNGPRYPIAEETPITPAIPSFSDPTKTPSPSNVTVPGGTIAYSIAATNSGTVPTHALTLKDTLPDYLHFLGNTAINIGSTQVPSTAYTVSQSGQALTLTITDPNYQLQPGQTVNITFLTEVSQDAPLNTYVQNTAYLYTGPDDTTGASANSQLPFIGAPLLTNTSKTASTQIVAPGDTFTYTVSATQAGDAPTAPYTVRDPLPAGLTYVSETAVANLDGNPTAVQVTGSATEPIFTMNEPLRSGSTMILTFTVQVASTVAPDTLLSNTAYLSGYPGSPEQPVGINTKVGDPSFTEVSKTPSATAVLPGDTFSYTITAKNNTPLPIDPFQITENLPEGLTATGIAEATINGQSVPVTLSGNSFNLKSALAPGAVAILTFQVQAAPNLPDRTQLVNTATIHDPYQGDLNVTAPPVTITAPIFPGATKTPSVLNVNKRETFSYTVTATNAGGSPTSNPFQVLDALPAGLAYANSATATINGQTVPVTVTSTDPLAFDISGSLNTNDTLSLTFQVMATQQATNGLSLTNTATIKSYPADPGYPIDGQPLGIGTPDFANATKTAYDNAGNSLEAQYVSPAGTVIYRITATNTGTGQAVGPFRVVDRLPDGMTFDPTYPVIATFDVPNSGTFQIPLSVDVADTGTNQALIFEHPLASTYLPVGTTVTFDYRVKLDPNMQSPITNRAIVYADPQDQGNITSESVIYLGDPDFSNATKTADSPNPTAGIPFTYTYTAQNNGNAPAQNYTLQDALPSPLIYNPASGATATIDGTPTSVTISGTPQTPAFTIPDTIPIGATLTLTFQVSTPYTATGSITNTLGGASSTITLQAPPLSPDTLTKTSNSLHDPESPYLFPGDDINYSLNWSSPNSYPQVTLTDTLPPYVTFPTGAVALVNGQPIPNTGTDTIPVFIIPNPGSSLTLTFTAHLDENAAEGTPLQNSARMSNGTSDTFATDDPLTVEISRLTLQKTAEPAAAYPGQTIRYTVSATNNGNLSTQAFSLTEMLPTSITLDRLQNIQATINSQPVDITTAGTQTEPVFMPNRQLAPGDTFTLNFETTLPASLPGNTVLQNMALAKSYPSDIGEPIKDAGVKVLPPLIDRNTFQKSVTPTTVAPNGLLNYTLTFNSQDAINTDLTLTDYLPLNPDGSPAVTIEGDAHVTVNNSAYIAPNTGTQNVPIFTIPAPIPQYSTVTLTFTARYNGTVNGRFTNYAVLHDGGDQFLTASDEPGFFSGPLFVPLKTSETALAAPGQQITYNITATNLGNQPASPFSIAEMLPLGMRYTNSDIASATINDQPVDVTITQPAGPRQPIFTLQDPVPVGATVTVTFTAHVNPTAPIGSTLVNSAIISAYPSDPGTTIWDQGTEILANGFGEGTLTKSYDKGGFTLTFLTDLIQTTDLTITDQLPDGLTLSGDATVSINNADPEPIQNDGTPSLLSFLIPKPGGTPFLPGTTLTLTIPTVSTLPPGTPLQNTATISNGYWELNSNTLQFVTDSNEENAIKGTCYPFANIASGQTIPLKCCESIVAIKCCKNSTFILNPCTTYTMTYHITLQAPFPSGRTIIGLALGNTPITGSRLAVRPKGCDNLILEHTVTFTTGPKCQKLQLLNYSESSIFVARTQFELSVEP